MNSLGHTWDRAELSVSQPRNGLPYSTCISVSCGDEARRSISWITDRLCPVRSYPRDDLTGGMRIRTMIRTGCVPDGIVGVEVLLEALAIKRTVGSVTRGLALGNHVEVDGWTGWTA
jgi:hypothetical protein